MQRYKHIPMIATTLAVGLSLALATACGLHPTDGSRTLGDTGYTGSIRISFAHPSDANSDQYEMPIATGSDAVAVGICLIKTTPTCTPDLVGKGYFPADLIKSTTTKKFFKVHDPIRFENGLLIRVVASDGSGKVIDGRNISLVGTGTPAPTGATGSTGATGATAATGSTPTAGAAAAAAGSTAAAANGGTAGQATGGDQGTNGGAAGGAGAAAGAGGAGW